MKALIATLLLAGPTFAATITTYSSESAFINATALNVTDFSATGPVSAAPGGFMVALNNPSGPANETVTILSDVPLVAFGATWDNLPYGVGTGIRVYANNTFVGQFGVGVLFQDFWGFTSTQAFSSIRLETNSPFAGFVQEHATLVDMRGSAVPEPAAWSMIGAALIALRLIRRR